MTATVRLPHRTAPLLLGALLVVCLGYQAYRYPFQINSALTSPTYSDTPAWLQYTKWGLVALIAVGLALLAARGVRAALRSMSRVRAVALVLQLVLMLSTLLRIAAGAASVEPWIMLLVVGTAFLVTLTPVVSGRAADLITRILVVYAVVCVVAEIVQVALFLWADRLPALAYANSPSVRFGSVLDDPNGFAVVLAALIPTTWIAMRARPNLRLVVTVALLCCLPLSQSWTGVTGTVAALGLTYLFTRGIRRDLRRAIALVTSAFVVVGVAAFFARSTITELIRLKQGSVESHAQSFSHIAPPSTPEPTMSRSASPSLAASAPAPVEPVPPHGHAAGQLITATWIPRIESGYINLFANYGPLLLIAYISLGVIAVLLLLRGRTGLPLALRAGGASYLICFLLASANLGLDRTFPCNVLYFFFCGLAFAASLPSRGEAVVDRRPSLARTVLIGGRRLVPPTRHAGPRAHEASQQ